MFNHSIQANDSFYEVHAEQIADRLYEGQVATAINVRWRSEAAGGGAQTAEFIVQTDQERNSIQLMHEGEVLGEIDLDTELPPESADPAGVDEILAPELVQAASLASLLIGLDPAVGCLIKGAALSVAEQTIRCWKSTNKSDSFYDRAHATAGCIRQNGMRVGWNFIKRVGRCLISAGLD